VKQPGQRVVVVGGGFAGLIAARRLKHVLAQVTLVDRTANHVFQPLLYHQRPVIAVTPAALPRIS
jgi:NADH dehydrogenase